jgi:DNA-binding GntR family transcriptional regulator
MVDWRRSPIPIEARTELDARQPESSRGECRHRREPAMSAGTDARVVPMRRQTIAVQICALLRREIIAGALLPRALLSEHELSQRFGVSRTPVREALIKLGQENLVEIYPQYGSFVAPIKLRDVYDSQFVREALECTAVERAAERIDEAQARALNGIIRRQRVHQRAGDEPAFFVVDEEMHATIMEIAGHANAWRQVESAKAQMDRVRHLTMRLPRKLSSVVAEHQAIVDRLVGRDRAGAVEAMRVHVRGLFRSVEILKREHADYFAEDELASTLLRPIVGSSAAIKAANDPQPIRASGHEDH